MMLEVVVGDRVRRVSITQRGALLHVTVDGHAHLVDAKRIGDNVLSLLVQSNGDARPVRSIDAAIVPRTGNGELEVHVGGRTVPLQIREPSSRSARSGSGPPGAGPQRVTSPMPGTIVALVCTSTPSPTRTPPVMFTPGAIVA